MHTGLFLLLFLANFSRYSVMPPLQDSPVLDARAQSRAEYLCTHEQPPSNPHAHWEDSFDGLTYVSKGENIARNFRTYGEAHMALMHSQTHRENIMQSRFSQLGLGESCGLEVELFAG